MIVYEDMNFTKEENVREAGYPSYNGNNRKSVLVRTSGTLLRGNKQAAFYRSIEQLRQRGNHRLIFEENDERHERFHILADQTDDSRRVYQITRHAAWS